MTTLASPCAQLFQAMVGLILILLGIVKAQSLASDRPLDGTSHTFKTWSEEFLTLLSPESKDGILEHQLEPVMNFVKDIHEDPNFLPWMESITRYVLISTEVTLNDIVADSKTQLDFLMSLISVLVEDSNLSKTLNSLKHAKDENLPTVSLSFLRQTKDENLSRFYKLLYIAKRKQSMNAPPTIAKAESETLPQHSTPGPLTTSSKFPFDFPQSKEKLLALAHILAALLKNNSVNPSDLLPPVSTAIAATTTTPTPTISTVSKTTSATTVLSTILATKTSAPSLTTTSQKFGDNLSTRPKSLEDLRKEISIVSLSSLDDIKNLQDDESSTTETESTTLESIESRLAAIFPKMRNSEKGNVTLRPLSIDLETSTATSSVDTTAIDTTTTTTNTAIDTTTATNTAIDTTTATNTAIDTTTSLLNRAVATTPVPDVTTKRKRPETDEKLAPSKIWAESEVKVCEPSFSCVFQGRIFIFMTQEVPFDYWGKLKKRLAKVLQPAMRQIIFDSHLGITGNTLKIKHIGQTSGSSAEIIFTLQVSKLSFEVDVDTLIELTNEIRDEFFVPYEINRSLTEVKLVKPDTNFAEDLFASSYVAESYDVPLVTPVAVASLMASFLIGCPLIAWILISVRRRVKAKSLRKRMLDTAPVIFGELEAAISSLHSNNLYSSNGKKIQKVKSTIFDIEREKEKIYMETVKAENARKLSIKSDPSIADRPLPPVPDTPPYDNSTLKAKANFWSKIFAAKGSSSPDIEEEEEEDTNLPGPSSLRCSTQENRLRRGRVIINRQTRFSGLAFHNSGFQGDDGEHITEENSGDVGNGDVSTVRTFENDGSQHEYAVIEKPTNENQSGSETEDDQYATLPDSPRSVLI